eukprot:TRINITY_DN1380_c0_g1_i1.p2 TRINITY_DN1380_c0_g1~~TRINITY_DN1380_c0_g1_i1.p2  ORF type:complete len:301 (+),score=33.27 TRINITY_DN1380_c0_g1_i1:214-1116(+)
MFTTGVSGRSWQVWKNMQGGQRGSMKVYTATPASTPSEPSKFQPTDTFVQVQQVSPENIEEVTPTSYVDFPLETLKNALFDSVKYVDRGVKSSREDRSEIAEYVTQLEGKSPNPAPTEALDLLGGKWKLVYTSNPRFLTALNLPNVALGEIIQNIDTLKRTVKVDFQFKLPAVKTNLSVLYSYEIISAKRWKFRVEKTAVEKPVVQEQITLPQNVSLVGQNVDISQIVSPLAPIADQLLQYTGEFLDQVPSEFTLPQQLNTKESFILITYLDEDLKISKTLNGTIFIHMKDKQEDQNDQP